MEKERLFKFLDEGDFTVKDKIAMLLYNRVDFGGEQGGMISVKNFGKLSDDLIEYFKL